MPLVLGITAASPSNASSDDEPFFCLGNQSNDWSKPGHREPMIAVESFGSQETLESLPRRLDYHEH